MTLEDQLRAAGRAVGDQVRDLPDLDLTPHSPDSNGSSPRDPRRWLTTWLIPMAAAAAVILVAVSLVAVRTLSGPPRPGPSQSPVATQVSAPIPDQVPAYYAAITKTAATAPYDVTIAKTATGQALFTVKPPQGASFTQVTAAADDQTFVISISPLTGGTSLMHATLGWGLLRINPDATGYTFRMLPIPALSGSALLDGFALSPDGTKLAVMFMVNTPLVSTDVSLRVYSVATGKALHTWQSGKQTVYVGYNSTSDNDDIRWLADGQELSFVWFAEQQTGQQAGTSVPELRRVDLTKQGTGLIADSALVTALTGSVPGLCDMVQPAADGDGVLCGMAPQFATGQGAACVSPELPMSFYAYSGVPATYRLLYAVPVPKQLKGQCYDGNADVLWSSQSASVMVAMVSVPGPHSGPYTSVIGVISNGRWTQLPASVLDLAPTTQDIPVAF
jgi:hypothetical protein